MAEGCVKYVYTFIICFINITFGMGMSSFGPTFVDLKYILNTTMESISFFSFFISVGYVFGSLFGFLYKYINRQIVITVLVLCMAFATTAVPNAPQLFCFYTCAFIVGTCAGAWSNTKTVWLIELWHKRRAPVLHLCSFLFGVGTIIGPLIDKCYVTGELRREGVPHPRPVVSSNVTLGNVTALSDVFELINASSGTDSDVVYNQLTADRQSKLLVPFMIIGAMQFIGALVMAVMYIMKKYENKNHMISENQSNVSNELVEKKIFDNVCEKGVTVMENGVRIVEIRCTKKSLRVLLIALASLFLAFQMSSEVIYMQFSATYFQYIPLKLTAQTSAYLMSSMATTFTIGRGVSIFVAMRCRPQQIIVGHLAVVFVGLFVLFCGQHSLTAVWLGAVTMSYGLSPIICSTYCFLAQYLEVNNRVGTVLLFSAESLNLFVPLILGHCIELCPQIFIGLMFANISLSSVVFALILFVVTRAERANRVPIK